MAATLLTVGELREHLETDLSDEALQRILNAEEAEIVRRYGSHASAAETLPGDGEWLVLERTPSSITEITEIEGDATTVLAANDYRTWPGGRLERLSSGAHPRPYWAPVVTVAYAPQDTSAERRGCLIRLATLAANYRGLKSESVGAGDYAMSALDYNQEREALLRSLANRKIFVV